MNTRESRRWRVTLCALAAALAAACQEGLEPEDGAFANVAFRGTGVYALGPDDVSFTEITGGDVVSAWYQGSGSPAGRLIVSRYDEATGVIEGELSFSARTNSTFASYGHSARLDDGKFRTVVVVQPVNTRAP